MPSTNPFGTDPTFLALVPVPFADLSVTHIKLISNLNFLSITPHDVFSESIFQNLHLITIFAHSFVFLSNFIVVIITFFSHRLDINNFLRRLG